MHGHGGSVPELVRCGTAQILAIENLLTRQAGGRMSSNRIKQLRAAEADAIQFPPDVPLT